jgi:PAS domain S-box-containing protein
VTTDPRGLVTGWNTGAEQIFGFHREEILGKPSALLFTPEDQERHAPEDELETARTEGKAADERWHVRKDGTRFWGSGITTVLRDGAGRLVGFAKLARDLTGKKLATDALREEAARRADIIAIQRELTARELEPDELMRLITERAQALTRADGAVIALFEEDELVYQAASGQALAYLGARFRLDECLGGLSLRGVQNIKCDDVRDDECTEAAPLRQRGIRSLIVVPLFHQNQPIGTLEVHSHQPKAFSDSNVEHLSLLGGFIASLMVRATERQRLQAVLNVLPVGVTIADRSGKLLEANPATYAIWGAELPLSEKPERYDQFKAWWPQTGCRVEAHEWAMARAIMKGEISGPEEVEIETFGGERKSILNYARPIRDAAGRITGAVAVNVDFTGQKRARERLLEVQNRMEAAIRSSGQLFYDWDPVSDEITFGGDVEKVLGYSAREMPRRLSLALEIVHPEDRAQLAAELEQAGTTGKPVDLGFRVVQKDGTVRDVWDTGRVYSGAGKGAGRFVGFVRDITEQKRAQEMQLKLTREEAARTEAEAARWRLESILESITDSFIAVNRDWRITYLNQRAAHSLGRAREFFLGKNLFEEVPHLAGAGLEKQGRGAMEERKPVHLDTFVASHNVWLEVHIYPYEEGVAIYIRDITQRRRAEAEQRRLTAILEATPDLVGTFDIEGRLLYLNRAGQRLLGWDEAKLAQAALVDVHPEWASALLLSEGIPTAIREGTWSGETAVVCKRGKELPTSQVIIAHRPRGGAVEFLSTIARDIEDRKQAEEFQHFLSEASRALSGSLERQAILDSLTQLAVSHLADCCIAYEVEKDGKARPAAAAHQTKDGRQLLERLRGLPPEGDRQLGISRVLRLGEPVRVGEVTEAWLRATSSGEAHLRLLRELALTSVMIVPLRSRERTLGALFLGSQRRERRYGPVDLSLAEELANRAGLAIENARLYQESQRATRARDEVLAIVSHDLRNPLSTISMSGKLLLEKIPPEMQRERRQLEIIQRSAEWMNRLIQDLLEVARMEAGHLPMERRREEVAPLVHDALELQRTLAEKKGIHLAAAVAEALPAVEVDRERIQQVLQNLIGNALRFTPEGGRISLRAWQGQGEVHFSVADTGPGIAEEALPHLFEPFWQAGRTEGAGLGLAIVKGIVEAHGGRIWVESQLGHGTTFIFTVPVRASVVPGAPPLIH